jgi:cell division protein FtsI/penicillin-binding protein 2
MTKLPDQRLRLIVGLFGVAFALVIARAIQIQLVQAGELSARARGQQNITITVPTQRGRILDRVGKPLAQDLRSKDLMVHPSQVEDPQLLAQWIAQKTGYKLFNTKLKGKGKKKHEANALARKRFKERVDFLVNRLTAGGQKGIVEARVLQQLTPTMANRIMAPKPKGLFLRDSVRRAYPYRSQATQLIGYTNMEGSGQNGAGIELAYDKVLAGIPGERIEVRGPNGVTLETVTLRNARPGKDVQLTVDQTIQQYVQSVLERTVRVYRARSATAIVLDPRNGEVLAMAGAPSYDNNAVHNLPSTQFHRRTSNMAVEYSYEPGSTFKVVTMVAALTGKIVTPSMKFYNLPYEIPVGDKRVHDDAFRGPKTFTTRQILQQSSNVGTVTIAQMVGRYGLGEWIRKFGFGKPTSLGLPGEAPGIVLQPDKWYDSSIGNIPIGQGIAVTPMQMVQLFATIANGGVLAQPHVVKSVGGSPPKLAAPKRIIDAAVNRTLVDMLKGVVDSAAGTGTRARIPGYTVAGKTGTAQKALEHGLGYSKTDYVASFVGFLPADNPRVEVLVVVDSPHRGGIFGGLVAAPAFKDIATFLTQRLPIPPDRPITGG